MKITDSERELIEIYHRAKQDNNTDVIISLYALLDMSLERECLPMSGLVSGYTRGQYKRAIKLLRETQAWALYEGTPGAAEHFDCAVRYLRECFLNRVGGAA